MNQAPGFMFLLYALRLMPTHKYTPIDCGYYDYLELACLHQYTLDIELYNGESVSGIAHTTRSIKDAGEFLLLQSEQQRIEIRLDNIRSVSTRDTGAHFKKVNFPRARPDTP